MQSTEFPAERLSSWQQYVELTSGSKFQGWVFRGQRRTEWELWSSLSRYLRDVGIPERDWGEREERVLRVFKRKAHLLLTHVPEQSDDFQWLALMQHHGAQTRLLDFTWSPYVAAFFALEQATTTAAVWALNPYAKIWGEGLGNQAPGADCWRSVDLSRRDPEANVFASHYLPGKRPFVWVGNPFLMNRRLNAQSGTFAVPGIITQPLEKIAPTGTNLEDALVKFELPAGAIRKTAMWELFRMNVTNATLFPDLDGLARSMAYELEFIPGLPLTEKPP
jgi:hypothetical protein